MKTYKRSLISKSIPLDTPQIRAAINLVNASDNNQTLDQESLKILAFSFKEIFGGKNPKEIFQKTPLGLSLPNGRPKDSGFKACDIVTAVYELKRRECVANYSKSESAALAKAFTIKAFEFEPGASSSRQLDRDLQSSDLLDNLLSNSQLKIIIEPYEKSPRQK